MTLFLKGEYELHRAWAEGAGNSTIAHQAASYYEESTRADPQFSLAYAALGRAQLSEYHLSFYERGTRDQKLADAAKPNIERALLLTPDLAIAHLGLGEWYLWIDSDFAKSTAELQHAIELDPHLTDAFIRISGILRLQNQPDKAAAVLKTALDFDPRNIFLHRNLGIAYTLQRQFRLAVESYASAIALESTDTVDILNLAGAFESLGDIEQATRTLETYPANRRLDWSFIADKLHLLFLQRDYQGMVDVLKSTPTNVFIDGWTRPVNEGQAARGLGQSDAARASFEKARAEVALAIAKDPSEAGLLEQLAYVDALLHRDEAIDEAKRAIELVRQNHIVGPIGPLTNLAQVYGLLGRADDAMQILEQLFATPASGYISVSALKTDPDWDLIRNDPRFQKLCEIKLQ